MAQGMKVQGGRELARAFDKLGARAGDLHHDRPAELVAARARATAPRLTGALADSVEVEAGDDGAVVTIGGDDVPYAGPIHYGWRDRNIEPQPFLVDALEDSAPEIRDAYANEVAGLVRRFDREAP